MVRGKSDPGNGSSFEGEQRVLLGDVRWQTFEALLHDLDRGSPRGRLAYDRGLLEIMSPSSEHEYVKTLIGRFIEALTEELGIPVRSLASTTLKRKRKQTSIEADECYYVGHDPLAGLHRDFDLGRDPPPDLAVEVDISRSSLVRMAIHAKTGMREVWRWYGDGLEIWRLGRSGVYRKVRRSTILPMLPIPGLVRFLERRHEQNETDLARAFRRWVRAGFPERRPR